MTQQPVLVLALGGTIAMTDAGEGARPDDAVARSLADEHDGVALEVLANLPSASLGMADVLAVVRRIRHALADGVSRFVIAQGTDTVEDVAFALALLVPPQAVVAVTGAMRPANHPEADGPGNLRDAIAAARTGAAGVVAVLDGLRMPATAVTKHRTSGVPGFRASAAAPVTVPPIGAPEGELARVALVRIPFGDDGAALQCLPPGTAGVVLEALGGGHVPAAALPAIDAVVARMPVVLATRIHEQPVLDGDYGYPGSERDLFARGVLNSRGLGADRARIALLLALSCGWGRERIAAWFGAL